MSKQVIIVGAGIGGLTAAIALIQRGVKVSVYEQAAELYELGAGTQISPNGSCVLSALGLEPAIGRIASRPTSRAVRLYNTEQRWPLPNSANAVERYGAPFWLVHRGDLHQVLAAALDELAPGAVHVGARGIGFEQNEAGVTLLLENGARIRGDALIGADGVHSRTREILFSASATFTGFIAWRGVVQMERLPQRLRQEDFTVWMGPTGLVVTYPMRGGELLNFVADVERSDWLGETWSDVGTTEECQHDFASWHDDLHKIVAAIPVPYKWALLTREPLECWSVGRVSLLGDACHPLLPFLGQGASMAIEDGVVLARCLSDYDDIPEALRRYELARLGRTSRVAAASLDRLSHMHNPQLADPYKAQTFMERLFAPGALVERYDWIFEYRAVDQPI